jgi:hypothetical protein
MIAVKVSDEDRLDATVAHAAAQKLMLRSLAAIEQQYAAVEYDRQRRNIALA